MNKDEQIKRLKNELELNKAIVKALVPIYYVRKAWRNGIVAGFAFGFILSSCIWSLI